MLDDKNHLVDDATWTHKGREETEPAYFVDKPKVSQADLEANYERQNATMSLGQGADYREDAEETEPEVLTDPPEYDVEEVTDLHSSEAQLPEHPQEQNDD